MIRLYSNESSYYSMIARLILAEKNVEYVLHNVDIHFKMEQFDPEYVKIQPNMTVPALIADKEILDGSDLILRYINAHFPNPDLYPEKDRALIDESLKLHYAFSIESLTMGKIAKASPMIKFVFSRALNKATKKCHKLMAEHPEFIIACQHKLNLENERKKSILSTENNYEETLKKAEAICDTLEAALSLHQYIISETYSLADVVWTVFLSRLYMIGLSKMITSRKNLSNYWLKVSQRESFNKADIKVSMSKSFIFRLIRTSLFNI